MSEILRGPRPLIMGILNVTPDSFSDGGAFLEPGEAIRRGERMLADGADIIDVGGESTRPGSEPEAEETQMERVLPVIRGLRRLLPEGRLISIDTTRLAVARAALDAGADLVNDISAGMDDPPMLAFLGKKEVPVVLMHRQGTSKIMQDDPRYSDVVAEVLGFLLARAGVAAEAGIPKESIFIDPGIGFGKRREDNLKLLAGLDRFVATGYPVLLGASRKRFMGSVCGENRPTELLGATVATTALGVEKGVKIFRVHDVRPNRQAAEVVAAIVAAGQGVN